MSELIYPPEKSAAANNATRLNCSEIEGRQRYAICLNVIAAKERGDIRGFERCTKAIDAGLCNAMKLRAKELEVGRALFYKKEAVAFLEDPEKQSSEKPDRRPTVDKSSESYQRGWALLDKKRSRPKAKPLARRTASVKPVEEVHYDLAAVAKSIQAKETKKPLPGETPIEYAKRVREEVRRSA